MKRITLFSCMSANNGNKKYLGGIEKDKEYICDINCEYLSGTDEDEMRGKLLAEETEVEFVGMIYGFNTDEIAMAPRFIFKINKYNDDELIVPLNVTKEDLRVRIEFKRKQMM